MGIGPDVLHAVNPKLIIVRVSGWGQDGPYRDKPGFGSLVEGMSGFAAKNGYRRPSAGAAAARARRHGGGALRRERRADRAARDRAARRHGPGDRPAAARSDLLGARPGSRDLPADAAHRAARRQPLAQHRAAQRLRDAGRPLHLDLGLDPDHGGAAVPRDRPRRHDRRSALPHQRGPRAQHRRMRPRRSPNSSRRARSPKGSRCSRPPRSPPRRSTTSTSSSPTRMCRRARS